MIRAIALMWCYNEIDILPWVVEHALNQGIDVWVQDNYSTDGSYEWAVNRQSRDTDRMHVLRWPPTGPTATTSWEEMLKFSELQAIGARMMGYQWVSHWDADELRWPPRPRETVLDALDRLDRAGYTAVDHEVTVYKPRDGWPQYEVSPDRWFTDIVPGHIDQRNGQVKTWKQPAWRVDLASTGGHRAAFRGCKIAPERFRLDHYPLRTAAQMRAKLLSRAKRWAKAERERGWHVAYNTKTPWWT